MYAMSAARGPSVCTYATWLGLVCAVAMGACYTPDPLSGLPCSPTGGCPAGQQCVDEVCRGGGPSPDADPNAPDAEPTVADSAPVARNLIAFITVTQVAGDFGGPAAADLICQQEAAEAGLPGDFIALFNTSSRVGSDTLTGSAGWVNTIGDRLIQPATDWNTARLINPIRYTATGDDPGRVGVWFGASQVETCGDWSSTAETGGTFMSTEGFTFNFVTSCASNRALLCAETGAATVLPPAPFPPGKLIFVSSELSPGGGLVGADAVCVADASSAGLANPSDFRAAIAITGSGAFARFSVGSPLVRTDGELVASDGAALFSGIGSLRSFANRLASGAAYQSGTPFVWIGADAVNCTDWTGTQGDVFADLAIPEASFRPFLLMSGFGGSCNSLLPVLCIEA